MFTPPKDKWYITHTNLSLSTYLSASRYESSNLCQKSLLCFFFVLFFFVFFRQKLISTATPAGITKPFPHVKATKLLFRLAAFSFRGGMNIGSLQSHLAGANKGSYKKDKSLWCVCFFLSLDCPCSFLPIRTLFYDFMIL